MILAGLFAALTAIGAYIYIPLPISPVPITLQIFFVFMAGGILGRKYGFFSQLIYIMIGIIGLPVFTGGKGGIGILFGPTGGYILGFLVAGYISGIGKRKFSTKILAMSLALIFIYFIGTVVLIFFIEVDLKEALTIGVVPFLIGDLIKLLMAAYLSVKLSNYIQH